MTEPPGTAFQDAFETWLLRARWLLAPIYAGLVVALAVLVVVFAIELGHILMDLAHRQPKHVIMAVVSLVDVSLAANLVLIVVLSGFRNFVSGGRRGVGVGPKWIGDIDFGGLKLRLIASVIAMSAVALLKGFVQLTDGAGAPDNRTLAWLVGIHLTFVFTGVMLAITDLIMARTHRAPRSE